MAYCLNNDLAVSVCSFVGERLKYGKTGQRKKNGKCFPLKTWNFRCSTPELWDNGMAGNIFSSGTDWNQIKLSVVEAELREKFSWAELIENRLNFLSSTAELRDSGITGNIFYSETDWKKIKFPLFYFRITELRDSGIGGDIFSSETHWKQIKFPLFHCGNAELRDSGIQGDIFSSGTDWKQIKFRYSAAELRETYSRVKLIESKYTFSCSTAEIRNCGTKELRETFSQAELILKADEISVVPLRDC